MRIKDEGRAMTPGEERELRCREIEALELIADSLQALAAPPVSAAIDIFITPEELHAIWRAELGIEDGSSHRWKYECPRTKNGWQKVAAAVQGRIRQREEEYDEKLKELRAHLVELATACKNDGTGKCRLCHMGPRHHVKCLLPAIISRHNIPISKGER